jgi:hypothetical protein
MINWGVVAVLNQRPRILSGEALKVKAKQKAGPAATLLSVIILIPDPFWLCGRINTCRFYWQTAGLL